jgi:hypothetical protein
VEALGRDNLITLIQRLDLYKNERQRYPIEDVAQQMARKDLRIILFQGVGRVGQAFRIHFQYPDRFIASTCC